MQVDQNIKVSVIVPIYNAEKYLKQCLESIIRQTLQEIEILCINDGSTDKSLEILLEYAKEDSRIKLLSKENTGYGDSMNCGLDMATGKYIGIVESDDYALPNMFEVLYDNAIKTEAEVVKSNYNEVYTEKEDIILREILEKGKYGEIFDPRKYLDVFSIMPSIWSAIYRKDFLVKNKIRFHATPGASYQDVSFAFSVWYYAHRILFLKEGFLCYRCDNGDSSVKSPEKVFCVMDEFHRVYEMMGDQKTEDENLKYVLSPYKFDHYIGNYRRVSFLYQYAYALKMSEEFQVDLDEGRLNRSYWTDDNWSQMEQIRQDPAAFFKATCCEYIDTFQLKPYTVQEMIIKKALKREIMDSSQVIIYGAGIYGGRIAQQVKKIKDIFGFAVTEMSHSSLPQIDSVPVYPIESLVKYTKSALVIVAVKKISQFPIVKTLEKLGFKNVIVIDHRNMEQWNFEE